MLNNKHDYDARLRDEGDNIDWLVRQGQQSPPIGSAIGIDTDIAETTIDGFGRWMWDEDVEGSQTGEWQTINDAPRGRANVTVEVTASQTDTPDEISESGVLTDASQSIDYVVFANDREHIPRLEEDECYAIKGAKIGEHDDAPQVVLDGGVREIETVEPGFGNIERPDAGHNTSIDDAARASTDGGEIAQLTGRVEEIVEEHEPPVQG